MYIAYSSNLVPKDQEIRTLPLPTLLACASERSCPTKACDSSSGSKVVLSPADVILLSRFNVYFILVYCVVYDHSG